MESRENLEAGGETHVAVSSSPLANPPAIPLLDNAAETAAEFSTGELAVSEPGRLDSLPRGSMSRQVVILALPVLAEQMGSFTVGLVDTLLAGHINKEAVAAVGVGSYLSWFVNLAFALVGIGVAALVSRAVGAGDRRLAQRALNQSLLMALALGVAMSFVAWLGAPLVAGWLTQTPDAHHLVIRFVRIDALGFALASINMVGAAALRAAGDMRTPMRVMFAVNIVNVGLGASLVYFWHGAGPEARLYGGPEWGLIGIAIGALVARSVGGLIMAGLLLRGVRGLAVARRLLKPDPALMWRMLRIGLPAAADTTVMFSAQMSFLAVVGWSAAGDAGTVNLAAHMIAMRAEAFSYLTAFAWATASATLVGQYLGARRPDDAARAGRTAAMQMLVVASGMGALFFFFPEAIYRLMTNDEDVVRIGAPAFRLIAFAQPFLALAIVFISSLRGAGDTRYPMFISIICSLFIRLPGAYIGGVVLGGGLIGAWCGMWADNITRAALATARFARGGWKSVRV